MKQIPAETRFHRATDWIVDYPWLTWVLLVVITGLATAGHVAPERVKHLFSSPPEVANSESETRGADERPPDVEAFSVTDAHAVVVVESAAFFTPRGADAIRHVVDALESQPHIANVNWMDRIPPLNIFGLREPLLPRSGASDEVFAHAREKALQNPLVVGQFLSGDARTLILLVNFDFFFIESDDDCIGGLRQLAEKAAGDFPDVDMAFSVTGRVPMYLTAMRSHDRNKYKYQLIGYTTIAIMALILFRGFVAVLIVAIAPCLGVFWTIGILTYFDLEQNQFNDVILPVLLSLVGLTDGVHLMVQVREFRASGLAPREAARAGIRQVGLACALTSLTTAIGFASLALAHHRLVREFGWCCVIGVSLTFVSVVTTIPLACASRLGRRVHEGHSHGLIDRNLGRISGLIDYVLGRRKFFGTLGVGSTFLLALLTLTLRPDERSSSDLPTHSEPAVALRKLDVALGGLETARVDVAWSRDLPGDAPVVLEVIQKVDALLREEELIGHPLSIYSLVAALPGDGQIADRMSLLDLLPPPLKRAFYTPEYRHATVNFRVRDLGIAKYSGVFERVEAGLAALEAAHPDVSLSLDGSAPWRWRHLYRIVLDLVASLGTASLIIFAVLACVYRSLRMGLISVIPNIFPLAVAGAFLVMTGQSLELVNVCAFTICLGIAVDDTIHFLTRFEEERRAGKDRDTAIRASVTGVGTALIMTTVVLVTGFATVLFSDSREHRMFAWMGAVTISAALLGDLVFLPALLARFAPERARRCSSSS
ncbi:MAG: MMPL family transporter [Planctomycetales bacterium]|nr:MMPL family transporter [Planctomycetales bacterium]